MKNIRAEKLDMCLPAIEVLGRSQSGEAVDPLVKAFEVEKRPLVRRYIVDGLGLLGSRLAQSTLAKALKDSDAQVRQSAVVALSSFGDAASQQALIDMTQNEQDFAVKANLVQALGRSTHKDAATRLKFASQDSNVKLRKMAQDEINKRSKNGKK